MYTTFRLVGVTLVMKKKATANARNAALAITIRPDFRRAQRVRLVRFSRKQTRQLVYYVQTFRPLGLLPLTFQRVCVCLDTCIMHLKQPAHSVCLASTNHPLGMRIAGLVHHILSL